MAQRKERSTEITEITEKSDTITISENKTENLKKKNESSIIAKKNEIINDLKKTKSFKKDKK